MKKGILLVSLFLTAQASFGQLTQANEPAAGASSSMYVVDTMSVTMSSISSVTGAGVTWDYSTVAMAAGSTESIVVNDASASTTFVNSTKSITQGTIEQYFNSTTTERVSQGYIFTEPTFGVVTVILDANEAKLMDYPFAYNNTSTDTYSGTLSFDFQGMPVTGNVTGNVTAKIDGTGTLRLPDMDIPNVFRLTTIDTTVATGLPAIQTAEVIRVQHEYYDLADQNLPIFVDLYITISGMGGQRQVLSKNFSTVGIENATISNVVLFPNPSNGEFTISGDFAKGAIEVVDMSGRTIHTAEIVSGAAVKLTNLKSGMYTVKVKADGKASIQKITIK